MELLISIALICGIAWLLFALGRKRSESESQQTIAPAATDEPARQPRSKPVPAAFDLNDPSIGNPRQKMSALGWNQVVVLNNAVAGYRILYADPGRSNAEDGLGGYHYQRRTVDSLVKAEFLAPTGDGGFVITPLGCKALHTLPERAN